MDNDIVDLANGITQSVPISLFLPVVTIDVLLDHYIVDVVVIH